MWFKKEEGGAAMKSQFNSKGLEITGIQSGLADCAGSAAPEKRESVRDRSETDGGGEKRFGGILFRTWSWGLMPRGQAVTL